MKIEFHVLRSTDGKTREAARSAAKSMAKKKKTENRTNDKFLPVRVPHELIELIRRAATKDNRTLSNWVRDRIEKAAKRELGED